MVILVHEIPFQVNKATLLEKIAANVRDKYWLYVVVDCATDPKLLRVRDPIRLAFKTRQSFTLNIGDVIKEAEPE